MRLKAIQMGAWFCSMLAAVAVSCGDDDDDGGNPAGENCPGEQPLDGDPCVQADQPEDCQYELAVCECTSLGWDCEVQAACPSSEPSEGSDCPQQGQECEYGDTTCRCTRNEGWNCVTPVPCPDSQPATAAACENPGQICDYDQAVCQCTQEGWRCEPQPTGECPELEPGDGDDCDVTLATQSCEYGDVSCTCALLGGGSGLLNWVCATCPNSEPSGDCDEPGVVCDYGDTSCACIGGMGNPQWQCG
jgi:hypothetical protein